MEELAEIKLSGLLRVKWDELGTLFSSLAPGDQRVFALAANNGEPIALLLALFHADCPLPSQPAIQIICSLAPGVTQTDISALVRRGLTLF